MLPPGKAPGEIAQLRGPLLVLDGVPSAQSPSVPSSKV
jgi:hypothetical protein